MKPLQDARLAGVAMAAIIALACRDLWFAWGHAPYDRLGGVAFGVWLAGGVGFLIRRGGPPAGDARLFLAGLGLALAGIGADVNAGKHGAFALVLAGFLPAGSGRWWWLAAAASWLPALGWLLAPVVKPETMVAIRLSLAAGGALRLVATGRRGT